MKVKSVYEILPTGKSVRNLPICRIRTKMIEEQKSESAVNWVFIDSFQNCRAWDGHILLTKRIGSAPFGREWPTGLRSKP